jgi:hypothetical protein
VGGEKVLRERERGCLRTKGSWKHRRTRDGERNREKGLKEKYRGVNWGDILRTRKKKKTGEVFREDIEGRT